jgi:ABC-type multidrug transport system fused ATPase/permease subunit
MAPQQATEAGVGEDEQAQAPSTRPSTKRDKPSWTKLNVFLFFLALDALASVLLLSPLIPKVTQTEDASSTHYVLHRTLWDLGIMTALRIAAALYAILYSFLGFSTTNDYETEESRAQLFHNNGDRKSKADLEEEALQEPILPKIVQYMKRPAFLCECTVFWTGVLLAIKCLVRLDIEIASGKDVPEHPTFWAVLFVTGFFSFLETLYIDQIESVAGDCGHAYREQRQQDSDDTNDLAAPLLANDGESQVDEEQQGVLSYTKFTNGDVRGHSNIGADANYKAKISDLLKFCAPDKYWMMCAFLFLLGAAATQVFIPKLTGDILDALISNTNNHPDDDGGHSIMNIPNFVSNIEKLTIAAVLGGIFGGCRGAIFSMVRNIGASQF